MKSTPPLARLRPALPWLIRLIGLALLAYLLSQLDLGQALSILRRATPLPVVLALLLLIPLISIKAIRWNLYLQADGSWSTFSHSLRVYFSGLFLGFVTPGRLGEFARAYFARHHVGGSVPQALLTVLVDRLYDLAALLVLGGAAILAVPTRLMAVRWLGWVSIVVAFLLPLLIEATARGLLRRALAVSAWPWIGPTLADLMMALEHLPSGQVLRASLLTIVAYGVFIGQGYLLAGALDLRLGFAVVAQAVALGSLAALLPVSVSGLGTREWAITLFLGSFGVAPEQALAFSSALFLVFNVAGGLIGGIAWFTLSGRPSLAAGPSGIGKRPFPIPAPPQEGGQRADG